VLDPERAADETLDRLARRMAEGVEVHEPAAYVTGIARLVALEHGRHERRSVPLPPDPPAPEVEDDDSSERAACLEQCLSGLSPDMRQALLDYYTGEGRDAIFRRQRVARRLGVSATGLRLRMFRQRLSLETCVRTCLGQTPAPRNIVAARDTRHKGGRAE
jgi:DNA-directed RNA polymerase specialized sigma24 family protein